MYLDDAKLVAQTLSGDGDAFGVLVHKYQEMVYAYVFHKVNNEADAQDITQEIFLRAYRHLNKLRHPHQFRSWLYTIMSNECNRWLGRVTEIRQRETSLEDATEDDLRIESKHATPTEKWRVDLEQAISKLPDDNRIAVSMFYMSDCSLQEISEFLGVSVNTVKGKLHRARQQLGNALSEHYGKLLKSHKLKGGFLMQVMNQMSHTPAPTMTFTWNSTIVAKLLFSLITAFCILIGGIAVQDNSTSEVPTNRIEVGLAGTDRGTPLEVALLSPIPSAIDPSLPVLPVQTEARPPVVSTGASSKPGPLLADRGGADANPQLPAAAAAEVPELELDVIVAGVKYNDSLLKTGKGDFIVRQVMSEEAKRLFPTGIEDDIQLKVAFDGVKVRCETVGDMIEIFDGEKQVEIYLSKRYARVEKSGMAVGVRGKRTMDPRYDPRHWGLYKTEEPLGGGKPLGEYLGKHLEERVLELVGPEQINGILCYVVRVGPRKFWIAPEQGFRVLKSEYESSVPIPKPPFEKLPTVFTMETVYQEVKAGIWFPKSAVDSSFLLDKKTGKQTLSIRDFLTVKKIEVNEDVSDQFQFNIPPDTLIWDYRSSSERTAAEAGISTNRQ